MGLKYKDRYVSVKDIYSNVNHNFNRKINYSIFYKVIKKFFEIVVRDIVERNRRVFLPNSMGYIYLTEKPHKRAFHTRVDHKASKETGKLVTFKVPILSDFYKKIVWVRPNKYNTCKILPLGYSKKIIKNN